MGHFLSGSLLRRSRSRVFSWPLLLLVLSLGLMLAAAAQGHRMARLHRQTAEQMLADYSAFAAWTYQQRLSDNLQEVAWQVLNPILHRHLHEGRGIPDAADLIDYRAQSLRDCRCDPAARPATYFGFLLGSDTLGYRGQTLSPAASRALNGSLTRQLRAARDRPLARMGVVGTVQEFGSLVAYGLMPTARMDTVVYGFVYDPASLAPAFASVLQEGELLPQNVAQGRSSAQLIALEVLDSAGGLIYRDPAWPRGARTAEERLPTRAGSLLVHTTVRPEAVGTLLGSVWHRTQLTMLVGVVGLALLLAIVALVQLRRENELARIRGDFVANVSHELRTPLAQLRLFLDTLRLGRYNTPEQRDWLLAHLVRETTRLEHLVDNVLQFSRLEHVGASPMRLEPVDPAEQVREILTTFEPLARSRHVTIETALQNGLTILADPARLRQVLLNLLDNAVKFGPPGQRITVVLEAHHDWCRLRVSDQGPGVPEEDRERVFEPYFRGTGAERQAVSGSGIGLAIVRDVVAGLSGRCRVEPAPGGGASFVVELPLVRQPVASPPTLAAEAIR